MRILLVKLSALGDVVQSLPVAMAIKAQDPAARVDWLVEPPAAPLLQGHPALERVIVSPRKGPAGSLWQKAGRAVGFRRALASVRYDAVVDLQGLIKSAILVSLCRSERKIGFAGGKEPAAALALNERLPAYDPDRHALLRYLDLLAPLGYQRPAQVQFGLWPSAEEESVVDGLLAGWDQTRPLILLHPVALWPSKLWPLERWVELTRLLVEAGVNVGVSGAAGDAAWGRAMVAGWAGAASAPRDFTGRTDLRVLAALQRRARAVVSTDTGAMHLAAAMGAPTLALFGPTAPWRTGPFGAGHQIIRLGLECGPCFRRGCANPRCMNEITATAVAERVAEMLAGPAARAKELVHGH